MKILLIDDDPDVREMTRMSLELRGHVVTEAANGRDGAAKAASDPPDVILLDVMMPDLDGPATLELLRRDARVAKVPVVFLTASVTDAETARLRAMEPAAIVSKPFDPVELDRQVAAAAPGVPSPPPRVVETVAEKESAASEFERMRANFLRRSREQLEHGRQMLADWKPGTGDGGSLAQLMRIFHRLAGISASFGVPRAGTLGKEGELACLALSRRGATPTAADFANWRRLLDEITAALEGPNEEATPVSRVDHAPRILVVDPDPEVRSSLVEQLANEGLVGLEAANQAEALSLVARQMPDALISDVALPDGDGCALVERVRAMPDGAELPIVVLSPHGAFDDKVEAIHCGADALFDKPVDWKALLRRVQHLLEQTESAPYRVLSVEDDADQAAFITSVLTAAGHEVRVCSDPGQFEAVLQEFNPDVVLMDVMLPGVSGYDLVRFLRQDDRYVTLPAIFLTTESQAVSRFRSARAGGDDHLVKPVSPPLLLASIAARVERTRFLRSLLERDGLTRLLNHSAFAERATVAQATFDRDPSRSYAWVMVDVDHFKSVNDRFGHPVGDRVLASLAALLRRRLRQTDTIGRYGGEEFAVLFDSLPEAEVVRLMDRVRSDFGNIEHDAADKGKFKTTFSAGVAMLKPGDSVDSWKKAADDALYAAKHGGRNRVVAASTMKTGG